MLIPRFYFNDLLTALKRPQIIALVGARQTGKTTLLKQLQDFLRKEKGSDFEDLHLFIDLDSLVLRREVANDERFLEKQITQKLGHPLGQTDKTFYLFLDEVQKYPQVLEILKILYDKFSSGLKIIITGSSSLHIMDYTSETLAGRIEYHYIYPFTFFEAGMFKELLLKERTKEVVTPNYIKNKQGHQQAICHVLDYLIAGELNKKTLDDLQTKYSWPRSVIQEDEEDFFVSGLYPGVVSKESIEDKFILLRNYIETYVERDIRSLSQVGDWQGYHRLLEVLVSRVGQLVDYSDIGNKAGLDVKTVRKYLSILEETFIIFTLPSYFMNVEKRVAKSPKIIFLDNGILSTFLKITDLQHYELLNKVGNIFENAMVAELMKYLKNRPLPLGIYFWRTYQGAEVDCVIQSEGHLIPLEFKWSVKLDRRDWSGLEKFKGEFKNQVPYGLILYRGKEVVFYKKDLIAIPYPMLFMGADVFR